MKQLLSVFLFLGYSVQAEAVGFGVDKLVGMVRGIVEDEKIGRVKEVQQITDGESQEVKVTINTHPFDEVYYKQLDQLIADLENAETAFRMAEGMFDETYKITEHPREEREQARAARRKIISQLEEAKIRYQNVLADPNADEKSLEQARLTFHRVWNEAIQIQNNLQRAQDSYSRAVDNVHRARSVMQEARENISQAVEACYKGFLGS